MFSLGKIEDIVASALRVPESRRSALSSKIKYYRKLGFPTLPQTGKGNPSEFHPKAALQLVIVFRLEDLGLPPKLAMKGAVITDEALGRSDFPKKAYLRFDGQRFQIVSAEHARELIDRDTSALLVSVDELLSFYASGVKAVEERSKVRDPLIDMALNVLRERDGEEF